MRECFSMRGIDMKFQFLALGAAAVLTTGAIATATPISNIEATFSVTSPAASSASYAGYGSVALSTPPLTIGTFSVTEFNATTNSPSTSGAMDGLSLFVQNTGSTSSTLTLKVSSTGFIFPGPSTPVNVYGTDSFSTSQASNTDQVQFTEYADVTNTFFGTGVSSLTDTTTFANGTPVSTYPNGVSLQLSPVPDEPQFSVTDQFVITLGSGASTTFTFANQVSPVPEPASMAVMGLAGAGALLLARRRKA
jgi:hypothetical protein